MILDTCILIEVLKGNSEIVHFLQNQDNDLYISSVSEMELYFGALNKKEIKTLGEFISLFKVLQIDEDISKKASVLVKIYAKSHSLNIPDSLIASTAIVKKMPLFTLNLKDFKYIKDIELIIPNFIKKFR